MPSCAAPSPAFRLRSTPLKAYPIRYVATSMRRNGGSCEVALDGGWRRGRTVSFGSNVRGPEGFRGRLPGVGRLTANAAGGAGPGPTPSPPGHRGSGRPGWLVQRADRDGRDECGPPRIRTPTPARRKGLPKRTTYRSSRNTHMPIIFLETRMNTDG